MNFTKEKVLFLNDLLNDVREEKDDVIRIIKGFCPKKITECDPNIESSPDAKNCEYFTLCNVLCSYSLMNDEEREEIDENFEELYSAIKRRNKGNDAMYM
ncbi:MAG: hypothetical protein PHN56_05160 [Candidatus Nanoarchaeia archaeon]|nr:hypothetical protein [Candidatus Nanoarchaeia archaeon]